MSRLDTRFDLFDRVIFGQGRATSVKLPNGRLRYTISELNGTVLEIFDVADEIEGERRLREMRVTRIPPFVAHELDIVRR